jgi:uncharacterized caspase-like protein/ABC-type phosphate transport system substrate-binding protein
MASNWAIVIGINQYRFLQPLKYAKRDAEAMHDFLIEEAGFDRIFLFTDDSPSISGKPTEPFRANLLRVLRQIFASPFMKDGDNFWFFFSGHGIPHNGQDYLMPLDGDPEDIENTGISTNTITNYLRSCGADNAVMILDACRNGGKKSGEGIGKQTEVEARQTGVISLFSCSPEQYSYELEAVGQGAFTCALLEALGIRGKCATVERLNQYLEHRVPELVNQHLQSVNQTPYTIAEPIDRSHLILMPKFANLNDIATLKNDAYRAQMKLNWDLAQRLWIRVNAAASGQDMDSIVALQNLGIQRHTGSITSSLELLQPSKGSQSHTERSSPSVLGAWSLNRINQFSVSASRLMTRQMFLKRIVPGGIGVAIVTIISPYFRSYFQQLALQSTVSSKPQHNSESVPKAGLTIDGSVSMDDINQALKKSFESQAPGIKLDLAANGTTKAIEGVLDGKVDLAAIARPLTAAEVAAGVTLLPIIRSKIALVVSPDNRYTGELTNRESAKIFSGEITDWSQVGGLPNPIRFIDRPEDSDLRQSLMEYPIFDGKFGSGATVVRLNQDSTAKMIEALGTDGIGYAIAQEVLDSPMVRVISIHGTPPNDPRYPFSQPRGYAFLERNMSSKVQSFLAFVRSFDAQLMIEDDFRR